MRFDLNLRSVVKEQMRELAKEMQTWQVQTRIDETEVERISNSIGVFEHTTSRTDLRVAGVDGTGDFPILTYADSFVYLSSFIPRSFPSYRLPIGEYMYSLDELLDFFLVKFCF